MSMIKAYLKGQQHAWDRNLGCLAAAYRASCHESTGMTPNLLMLGREVRLPVEVMFGSGTTQMVEVTCYGDYVGNLRSHMQKAHDVARKHLTVSASYQKQTYDAKRSVNTYQPGDMVWYKTDISQLHLAPKLRKPYEGPYLVVKRINDLNYVIQCGAQGKRRLVHHNKLKPYEGTTKFKWAKSALARANADIPVNVTDEPQIVRMVSNEFESLYVDRSSTMEARGRVYQCLKCDYKGDRQQTRNHVVMVHLDEEQVPFLCIKCVPVKRF